MDINLRRIMAFVLSAILLVSSTLTVSATNHEYSSNDADNLVPILVSESENQIIVAQVPLKNVAAYEQKLKNKEFREKEVERFSSANALTLPIGDIMAQKYLYRNDIKRAVDAHSGSGVFESLLTGPITDVIVGRLIMAAGFTTSVGFAAGILSWAINELRVKPDEWWTQSYIMILERTISCVRLSHIRNTGTSYPAAWLILERL